MTIATMTFDRADCPLDVSDAELDRLRGHVLGALYRQFPDFNTAALAQAEHRWVRDRVEGDPTLNLFSMAETFRAAVHGNARARQWESFIRDAYGGIAPYCFAIRFLRD